ELIWRAARSGATQRLAEEVVVIVYAVNLDAVERAALSAERQVAEPRRVAHDARSERDKIEEIATIDRQRSNLLFTDRSGDVGARGLEHGRLRGDLDRLADIDAQRQIEVEFLTDRQCDRAVFIFSEALAAGGDLIGSGWKSGEAIDAAIVSGDLARQTSVNIFNRDFGAGNDRAVRVSYCAFDSRGRGLLPEDRRDESEGE